MPMVSLLAERFAIIVAPAQGKGNTRRLRSPEVLAEFCGKNEFRHGAALEQKSQPERHGLPEQFYIELTLRGGGEVALLVELVVIRQEFLRDDAQNLSVLEYYGAVIQLPTEAQRTAHGNQHVRSGGVFRYFPEGVQRTVQKRLLKEEVLAGVAGNAEFRKRQDTHSCGICLIYKRGYFRAVVFTVGDLDIRGAGGNFYKSVLHLLRSLFILLSIIYYIHFSSENQGAGAKKYPQPLTVGILSVELITVI